MLIEIGTVFPSTGTSKGMRVRREITGRGEIEVSVERKAGALWPVMSTPVAIAGTRGA